ncbi:MAG: DUF2834 domain-containing protein [Pseudohongiellaceae bacterium]
MNKSSIYLTLAILGALIPIVFFADFALENGLTLGSFIAALFENGAVGGFTADLLISSVVFWVYMFSKKQGPKPAVFVLLNCCIGLSCALPAYLWASEKLADR